jgi:hypothetical protein
MTFTEKHLGQNQIASGTTTTLYTAPSGTSIVKDIHICNTSGVALSIDVYLDPDGSTADDTTKLFDTFNVPANDVAHWVGWQVMTSGGTVKAQASDVSGLTVTVAGAQIT